MKLENCRWKEFWLSDVFDIDATSSSIDKKKLNGKPGHYPYVTRTDKNNGYELFVGIQSKYCTDEGNVITIGLDTQTVFFQNSEFYTGQNIQVLRNQQLNKYIALFIIPLLKIQLRKFNWGGNGATLGRLRRLKVVLPTINNAPDYEFMEEYMREIERKQKERYRNYIQSKIKEMGSVESLETKKWTEFFISDLFVVEGTETTHPSKLIPCGNNPRITCSATNNGLDDFYKNPITESGDVLTIDSATIGFVSYQENDFLATDHVEKLIRKTGEPLGRYVGLFIKMCIDKSCSGKYGYGYKFAQKRIERQIVKLPVNSDNTPDYAFMETYMRRKEYEILEKYLK